MILLILFMADSWLTSNHCPHLMLLKPLCLHCSHDSELDHDVFGVQLWMDKLPTVMEKQIILEGFDSNSVWSDLVFIRGFESNPKVTLIWFDLQWKFEFCSFHCHKYLTQSNFWPLSLIRCVILTFNFLILSHEYRICIYDPNRPNSYSSITIPVFASPLCHVNINMWIKKKILIEHLSDKSDTGTQLKKKKVRYW